MLDRPRPERQQCKNCTTCGRRRSHSTTCTAKTWEGTTSRERM